MKAQIAKARLQGDIETRARLSSASLPSAKRFSLPPARHPPSIHNRSTFRRCFSRATTDAVLNFLRSRFLSRERASRVPKILPA